MHIVYLPDFLFTDVEVWRESNYSLGAPKKRKKKTVPPAFSQDCLYSSQELDSLVSERSFRGHFLSENVTKNYFMSLVQIAHDHVLRNHHHHDHFCRILRLGYTMHTKC